MTLAITKSLHYNGLRTCDYVLGSVRGDVTWNLRDMCSWSGAPSPSPRGAHGNVAVVWRHLGACHGHPLTQDTAIHEIPAEMPTYIHVKTCPVIYVAHTGN